jgi:hypothetical protein
MIRLREHLGEGGESPPKRDVAMTRQRRLLLASLLVVWAGMVPACGGGGKKSDPSAGASEQTIPYEVLKKDKRRDGKLIIELLVSESAKKDEVMKLAESLRREYAGRYAFISIFDSREAARRREDFSYPERELSRHWLVVVDWGGDTRSREEIRWVAEGRDK